MPAKKPASSTSRRSSQAAPRTRRKQSAPAVDAAGDDVESAALIDLTGGGWRDPPDGGRGAAPSHDAAGHPRRRRPEHAASRGARAVAARGLPLPGEDLPLRPRTDPGTGRPRPRVRSPGVLRAVRVAGRAHPCRPVPAPRRTDARVRPVLDRRRQQGFVRSGPGRARLRGEVLHAGGQLGPRRQQHPRLLHPGRDQVPRPRPRRQAGPGSRVPAGPVGARQLLGLHLADAGSDAHGDVDDVGPRHPPLVPVHGGLRRPYVPAPHGRRPVVVRQVPLEAEAWPPVGGLERGRQDQRRRSRLPPPGSLGRHQQR